jgi:hypothetical protein
VEDFKVASLDMIAQALRQDEADQAAEAEALRLAESKAALALGRADPVDSPTKAALVEAFKRGPADSRRVGRLTHGMNPPTGYFVMARDWDPEERRPDAVDPVRGPEEPWKSST